MLLIWIGNGGKDECLILCLGCCLCHHTFYYSASVDSELKFGVTMKSPNWEWLPGTSKLPASNSSQLLLICSWRSRKNCKNPTVSLLQPWACVSWSCCHFIGLRLDRQLWEIFSGCISWTRRGLYAQRYWIGKRWNLCPLEVYRWIKESKRTSLTSFSMQLTWSHNLLISQLIF